MKKTEKILIFLAILSIFGLFFVLPVFAQESVDIQPEELEVKTPTILPTSGIYPIKEFFRKLRFAFTFSPMKKAELRLKFANERLMEVKELAKDEKNQELIEKTLSSYQEELEKLKSETEKLAQEERGKFLEKYVNHALKQQMVLENIASRVKGEVFEKILRNRERHLERFKEVMEKVEDKEKLKEKIKETIDEVATVTPLRAVKVYETIKEVEEKVPEGIKPEIEKIKEEMVRKSIQAIKILPLEVREAKILEQFKMFADPLIAEEAIEKIKKLEPEIVSPPTASRIEALPVEIIQEKIAPLPETKKTEVLERMTQERIKHLERLEKVKEKLEKLPEPAVAPEVIERVIESQLQKIEKKIKELKVLPISSPAIEEIKEELKETPKIKEEIFKRIPEIIEIKKPKLLPPPENKEKFGFCGWETKAKCQTDDDCIKGGCSAQVCQGKNEEPIITTCEWRDCYNAEVYGVRCGCFEGKCQWNTKVIQ